MPADCTPRGLCQCGCGRKTNLARQGDTARGLVRGEPRRFIIGHSARVRPTRALIERFEAFVHHEPNTGCHLWVGFLHKGYGHIGVGVNRKIAAHRVAWELYRGPIPDGRCVLHNCPLGDEPSCVNPDHLYLGSQLDNCRDIAVKNRGRKGRMPYGVQKKGERRFAAKCFFDGATLYLGEYPTPEEASAVALAKKRELRGL
jgi:hypothetical protein